MKRHYRKALNPLATVLRHLLVVIFVMLTCSACQEAEVYVLRSPKNVQSILIEFDAKTNRFFFTRQFRNETIFDKSPIGFEATYRSQPIILQQVERVERYTKDTLWNPVFGEKSQYSDRYHQMKLYCSSNVLTDPIILQIRAYDEGTAFRFEYTSPDSIQIKTELTAFVFPADVQVWSSTTAQGAIQRGPLSNLDKAVERPLLAELSDTVFAAIGEANLYDFARMKFIGGAEKNSLRCELHSPVSMSGTFKTPWRYVMVARNPAEILTNNHLVLNLCNPDTLSDKRWIKPGKVIREVTLTTQGGKACIDFAARNNLQFVEFDAGWYGHEYDSTSDATTMTVDPKRSPGPLDLKAVIDYGTSKDIGIILYVNRRALEKQLDDLLPLYQSWGIQGLKYGFVNVGSQRWTKWLHEAVHKAATHRLMVDVHDEYRPTGISRTLPNLMTQEGIRGDEESATNSTVIKTLFTRMIAGAGDQTNCYFADRVHQKMGSHASQMAKMICIYSPWQFVFWYDRPEGSPASVGGAGRNQKFIKETPELSFYQQIPTTWDDTKILDGYPGKFAIIARRSESSWYLGILTGEETRNFQIPLSFLEAGQKYQIVTFSDRTQHLDHQFVQMDTFRITPADTLSWQLPRERGLAAIIHPN